MNELASGVILLAAFLGGGCAHQEEPERLAQVSSALTGTRTFQISVPVGIGVDRTVLASNGVLRLDDQSVVSSSGGALVTNAGSRETSVGNDAVSATLDSVASVTLRDRVHVNGNIVTAGTVTPGSADVISGNTVQHATLTPLFPVRWTATPPTKNGGDIILSPGASKTLASGSAYGIINVYSGARLTLTPGSYFAEQFLIEPQGAVIVQHQQQPVLLYVASALQLRGAFQDNNDASHFLLGFGGSTAYLETPFRGTLVAPAAFVTLGTVGTQYNGSFFGSSIEVQPLTTVRLVPFAHWDLFVVPVLSVTCVAEFNSTNFGVLFGYTNPLQSNITIAAGADNQFVPSAPHFFPVTQFAPGNHTGVTTVPLKGDSVTWQVKSMSARATPATLPRCTGNEAHLPPIATATPQAIDPDQPGPANPAAMGRLLPNVP